MLRPPEQPLPITVELLQDPADWQLRRLENGYLAEIGEPLLTEENRAAASRRGTGAYPLPAGIPWLPGRGDVLRGRRRLLHLLLRAGDGALEDRYVEPVFRRQGIARQPTRSAQAQCRERGVGSLTVCCAPCDEAMYRALGFNVPLGVSRACCKKSKSPAKPEV